MNKKNKFGPLANITIAILLSTASLKAYSAQVPNYSIDTNIQFAKRLDKLWVFLQYMELDAFPGSMLEYFKDELLKKDYAYAYFIDKHIKDDSQLEKGLLALKSQFSDAANLDALRKLLVEAPYILNECVEIFRTEKLIEDFSNININFVLGPGPTPSGSKTKNKDGFVVYINLNHAVDPRFNARNYTKMTLLHELTHVAHNQFESENKLLHLLWKEGLATFAESKLAPEFEEDYLNIKRSHYFRNNSFNHNLNDLDARSFKKFAPALLFDLSQPPDKRKFQWFGDEVNGLGYFLGTKLAEELGRTATMSELLALTPNEVDIALKAILQSFTDDLLEDAKSDGIAIEHMRDAIKSDDRHLFKVLLKLKQVNEKDLHGTTPLMMAAKYGRPLMMQALLDEKADLAAVNFKGRNALAHAFDAPATLFDNTLEFLLEKQFVLLEPRRTATSFLLDRSKVTLFMKAASVGSIQAMEELRNRGANFNATDGSGRNAMFYAIENGQIQSVEYLLKIRAKLPPEYCHIVTALQNVDNQGVRNQIMALIMSR